MKKVLDKLAEILGYIAGILFLAIFVLNIANIISRSIFNYSFLWVSDFSVLCIVWVICLGMSVSIYHAEHISIDFLVKKLNQKNRRILGSIISVIIIAFLVLLFYEGLITVESKRELRFTTLMWPLAWSYSALPVFAILSIFFMIPRLLNFLTGKSLAQSAEEKEDHSSIT